jgi:hypothetical protein
LQARSAYSVVQKQVSGTGTATITPYLIIGTFVSDLTYIEGGVGTQFACHATQAVAHTVPVGGGGL